MAETLRERVAAILPIPRTAPAAPIRATATIFLPFLRPIGPGRDSLLPCNCYGRQIRKSSLRTIALAPARPRTRCPH